jgi:hypothetical protein
MLTHRITIYVPHPPDKPDHYTLPAQVAKMLTEAAGGATVTEGQGYWKNDEGQLIVEPVSLVTAWYEPDDDDPTPYSVFVRNEAVAMALEDAYDLLKSVGEQSVAIETEEGMVIL